MLKINKPTRILAIVPGSRYLAVAVFDDDNLIYYVVKSVRSLTITELKQKVTEIMMDLVFTYQPDLVVQEKIYYTQCKTSERFKELFHHIKKLIKRMQIDYLERTPVFVRQQICQQSKTCKKKTFEIIADRYPELVLKVGTEKIGQSEYWNKLFNAVALGYSCWKKLSDR